MSSQLSADLSAQRSSPVPSGHAGRHAGARQRLARACRKAASASWHEWWVRGQQSALTQMMRLRSRCGWPVIPADAHCRSIGIDRSDLGQWWQQRGPRWFLSPERRRRIQAAYEQQPRLRQALLERAGVLLDGRLPIFSHHPLPFTGQDRWRRDPYLRKTAPHTFFADIEYLNPEQVGDSKHVWEPNRFGWIYPLGAAYVVTGDARYADLLADWTTDWFAKNPYPQGINYSSALEVGLRAYAWVWALDLFNGYLSQHPCLLDQLLHGIWTAGQHIENYLSYYFAPNTHLTGEAFALFACGAALPELRESARWRQLGLRLLAQEADRQFYQDGTHRELSSGYHLYSTDFYLHTLLIARQLDLPVPGKINDTARRLAVRLAELAPHDLILPQFNDCDGGRLTWFCSAALDAAPTLHAARDLLGHVVELPGGASHPFAGYDWWMAPMERDDSQHGTPPLTAIRHTAIRHHDSGLICYRNDTGDYLLFRSGPFGFLNCGHSHDAPTGVILYLAGQPLLVDSGVGAYTQSHQLRDQFRCLGKNILLVDGRGPSQPDGWFGWRSVTDARLTAAGALPEGGYLCRGEHDGFTAVCGFAVTVQRQVLLYDAGVLIMVDSWQAEQPVSPRLVLTLHPALTLAAQPAGAGYCLLEDEQRRSYQIATQAGAIRIGAVPFSPNYGTVGQTLGYTVEPATAAAGRLITVVSRLGVPEIATGTSGQSLVQIGRRRFVIPQ